MDRPARQAVRYLRTADGVHVAWAEAGSGPLLVKAANWLTHLEYDLQSPVWRHWIRFLADQFHFVRYDERGCGLSDRIVSDVSHEHKVEAEVIDPRTLRPLDLDTILASVRKTNRAVIVEEGWPHGGVGANLAALIQEQAFDWLDAPVQRVTGADVPMPYSKALEQAAMPHEEHVVKAALATMRDV